MTDGKKLSGMDEYPDVWVKFKTSGYPFSLTRTLDKSKDADESLNIVLRYVMDWSLTDIDGQPVTLPALAERQSSILDNVDESLATWLIRSFYEVRAEIIKSKNSLPPSPKAS